MYTVCIHLETPHARTADILHLSCPLKEGLSCLLFSSTPGSSHSPNHHTANHHRLLTQPHNTVKLFPPLQTQCHYGAKGSRMKETADDVSSLSVVLLFPDCPHSIPIHTVIKLNHSKENQPPGHSSGSTEDAPPPSGCNRKSSGNTHGPGTPAPHEGSPAPTARPPESPHALFLEHLIPCPPLAPTRARAPDWSSPQVCFVALQCSPEAAQACP